VIPDRIRRNIGIALGDEIAGIGVAAADLDHAVYDVDLFFGVLIFDDIPSLIDSVLTSVVSTISPA